MKLVELEEKEFKKFADKHEQITFHQTINWGNLKKTNGWISHYIGAMINKKIVAGALILEKTTPLKKNMFYSPRGFLIDYNDKKLLKEFTIEIKKYLKNKNGIFCKIDPYVIHKERDIDGNIIKDGIDNTNVINNLKELGYKHFGFNLMQDTLQPRWMFTLTFNGKNEEEIMKEMDPKTRQLLRKNERSCIKCREISYDEIKTFKDIMQHTGDRRDFIDRPLSYYQDMWNNLHDDGIFKILFVELHTKEYINVLEEEINQLKKEMKERAYKKDNNILKMNEKKFNSHQKQDEETIKRNEKKIKEIKALQKQYGDIITMGGISFLIYGDEVLSLNGGTYAEFMNFNSAYTLHWEMVKYAINNGYKRYNFYGITGDFNESNPLYGLYLFKRGFGGEVTELIGEFDLVINKPYYYLYKLAFSSYKALKNIKNKLRKNR
ncbi:MAG: peptidoglycan bridge formation glycyltransferase FemA/FemB family protein [Bacilli bacterium]